MLEAVTTDLVSPSAWSAAPNNLQLSTSWAGRLPHLWAVKNGSRGRAAGCPLHDLRTSPNDTASSDRWHKSGRLYAAGPVSRAGSGSL